MGVLDILEDDMTVKQMGAIMILYLVALAIFGVVAVIVIHGLGWQWL
jgi:hypothetical protein